jgi:thymidylate synthase
LLSKEPININPKLILKENKNFYDYTINDFEIINTENITKIKSKLELAI